MKKKSFIVLTILSIVIATIACNEAAQDKETPTSNDDNPIKL